MEDLDIIDENEFQQPSGRLPVFLKVLCILTFVGSGLAILGAIINLISMDSARQNFELIQRMSGNEVFDMMGINIEEMMKWSLYGYIASLVGGLMTLGAALMMWNLKKTGFYIYIAGCIIPLVVSVMAVKYIMSGPFEGFGMAGVVFSGMVSVAFIIMYGVNVKHLK